MTGHDTDRPMVFYKPGCPFGLRLQAMLTLHHVPHTSFRFRDGEVGAARVREANGGNEISPTVHVGNRWLTNPSWREVALAHRARQDRRAAGTAVPPGVVNGQSPR
jgi:mycoredoxin